MTAAPLARFGTLGDRSKAHVWTNAFEMPLSVRPNATIFHYDAITPEWKQKTEVKFSVLKSQEIIVRLQQRETRIFNPVGAFDGRHNLFSFVRYPLESASQSFYLDLDKDEQRRPRTVKVTVILVREVDLEILKRLRNASKDSISSALNLLNVFVQAQPKKDHLYNASSVFKFNKNTSDVVSIRPLELWRGVFQSVRPTFDRIVVNVDTTVGVVVPKTSLVQLCWTHLRDEVNLNHLGPQDFQQLRRFLRGIKVTVNHPGRLEPRAIKIRDLVQSVGEEVFEKTVRQKTGNVEVLRKVSITVAQHFRDSYNLTIPPGTLGIRGTHEMFPVMYCTTIQQLYRNKLSKDDAAEALKFGLRPPSKKLEDIKREWASLEHRQSEFLRGGGITFSASSHPLEVDGRKLNLPRITYGSSKIESIERDPGSWNMVGKTFKEPVAIGSWCIVNFTLSQITQFASKLRPAMQALGMVANEPKIKNGNASAPERALKEACREWQPDLILVMLNETDPDLYTMVKRFGDIKTGVRTQCIRWTKKLATAPSNQQNQYINNLLLKVNAKLGGINFVPEDAAMWELQSRDTMILGTSSAITWDPLRVVTV
ncbi:hypothetical protein B0H11DRAFT_398467 [Mycena galericulata]|nr:hypothetical protein B0H11DRAFT_398467 [Mycena galericulata]